MIDQKTQDDIDVLLIATHQLKDVVDQQQTQIQNLITSNRNLTMRLNRLEKQRRDDNQCMW